MDDLQQIMLCLAQFSGAGIVPDGKATLAIGADWNDVDQTWICGIAGWTTFILWSCCALWVWTWKGWDHVSCVKLATRQLPIGKLLAELSGLERVDRAIPYFMVQLCVTILLEIPIIQMSRCFCSGLASFMLATGSWTARWHVGSARNSHGGGVWESGCFHRKRQPKNHRHSPEYTYQTYMAMSRVNLQWWANMSSASGTIWTNLGYGLQHWYQCLLN